MCYVDVGLIGFECRRQGMDSGLASNYTELLTSGGQ